MSNLQRFADYAQAFEASFADDDWTRLERFFAPDAVYAPGDGTEVSGSEAVLDYLRDSVNGLDRRFDDRSFGETDGSDRCVRPVQTRPSLRKAPRRAELRYRFRPVTQPEAG